MTRSTLSSYVKIAESTLFKLVLEGKIRVRRSAAIGFREFAIDLWLEKGCSDETGTPAADKDRAA